ncbi:MAG: KTSC domain-containing protein [Parcubacteria group bacterium]|nr:KTSC domain-containing protein [Parcubacteria group bacterium]
MERQYVQSSNINSVGYDEESQTLEIKFRSGGTYQYYGVPKSLYIDFINASSIGRYFYRNIKGKFNYRKM